MNYLFSRQRDLAYRLTRPSYSASSNLQLGDDSRIAVIGGGPAGSLFSYFLLRLASKLDLHVELDIFEPRRFNHFGPAGCNHCGGIISESLVQMLAVDGINLPPDVVQRGIDAYILHTDVGNVRIETQLHEKRIASVYRGGGPKGTKWSNWRSFDQFLLELAQEKGAKLRHEMVTNITLQDGKPCIATSSGTNEIYDLAVFANGVNSHLLEKIEGLGLGFKRPKTADAFISELHLGDEAIFKYLGSAMHVFLLDLPGLEFAALIPKQDFVTVCLLGKNIDSTMVQAFMNSPEVQSCLPPASEGYKFASCHCFPRLNILGTPQPFADRILFVGDAGVTRLYKDGIGAAYRTAKAAANAAVLDGLAATDFARHFKPACDKIAADNKIGKIVFLISKLIQSMRFSRWAMVRMTTVEQTNPGQYAPMSNTLWDIFTGSAPYWEIFLRTMHPSFIARLGWNFLLAINPLRRER